MNTVKSEVEQGPKDWFALTLREKNILEHLSGIYSGVPQTLEIEAEKPVLVVRSANSAARRRLGVPAPTPEEVFRIRQFCLANPQSVTLTVSEGGRLVARGIQLLCRPALIGPEIRNQPGHQLGSKLAGIYPDHENP
ncbi:hypothetical protein F8R15_18800 [Thioclava sp. JE_KL1]|nr:hypothetical protein [Thioclava sp. JE_KL1]